MATEQRQQPNGDCYIMNKLLKLIVRLMDGNPRLWKKVNDNWFLVISAGLSLTTRESDCAKSARRNVMSNNSAVLPRFPHVQQLWYHQSSLIRSIVSDRSDFSCLCNVASTGHVVRRLAVFGSTFRREVPFNPVANLVVDMTQISKGINIYIMHDAVGFVNVDATAHFLSSIKWTDTSHLAQKLDGIDVMKTNLVTSRVNTATCHPSRHMGCTFALSLRWQMCTRYFHFALLYCHRTQ